MAIVQKYPIGTPKSNDLIIGTSIPDPNTNDDPKTVNFPISGISTLVAAEIPQGPTGAAGADGQDGANGTNGFDGQDGQDGAQGAAGADGTSIKILGTVANCAGLPTIGNEIGDVYILDVDEPGCSYGAGLAGDGYTWTAGNTWLNIGPLRGPQGIQGTDGAPGATGPAGTDGQDGAPGATGAEGPRGIQGLTGDTGAKGDQGEPGVDGADGVIQSVVAGTNVSVDASDPANPVVSANVPFGLTGSGTSGTLPIWTGSTELGDSFLQKGTQPTSLQTSNATATGFNSIAFGQNASSSSSGAIAFGNNAIAESGTTPIAIGYQAEARADSAASIGYSSESTGRFSTAIGSESQAYGENSTAIGRAKVNSTGDYAVAIGVGSNRPVASGVGSIIIGEGGEASGISSMIFGNFSTATGLGSKVIAGFSSSATGDYTVCGGYFTEAHDVGETVFGLFNKVSTGSQTIRPGSPPNNIFVVGNGTSTANRSNALELNDDGELTLPSYASNSRETGFAVEVNTGKIITADAPNYTSSTTVICTASSSQSIDNTLNGIIYLAWNGGNGTFDINLPDATLVVNYFRKFTFVLSTSFGSTGGKDVVLTPFGSQTINGVSSYTIPSAAYNVVEIWNRGGEWVIISKLT